MKRRAVLILSLIGAAALGWWGLNAWRDHRQSVLLRASVPARPPLAAFPPELTVRVGTREQTVTRDSGLSANTALAELAQLYHAKAS